MVGWGEKDLLKWTVDIFVCFFLLESFTVICYYQLGVLWLVVKLSFSQFSAKKNTQRPIPKSFVSTETDINL